MSSYKLTYLDYRARGETTRMMFALADQKYEDIRISMEEWPKIKPRLQTPFGQLPMMEVDGVTLCQSHTIERLVAARFGYYGENEMEQTKANMVVDCTEDLLRPTIEIFFVEEDKKATLIENYVKDKAPVFFENINNMVNSDGYFVGKKLSWADINFYNLTTLVQDFGLDISAVINKYPKLVEINDKVVNNPKIAAWMEKRPKTKY